jgi:hypothetical protein
MSQNRKRKLEKEHVQQQRSRKRAKERRRRAEVVETLGIGPATAPHLIRDYYQRAFLKWIGEVWNKGAYDPGPSPKLWAFCGTSRPRHTRPRRVCSSCSNT